MHPESRPSTLHCLQAHGSHREIGRALGYWGAQACHQYLIHTDAWSQIMAYRNHPAIPAIRSLLHRTFPWIEHELSGLAEGLGLPLEDVFLWNCRGDPWALAPDGCTTVLAPRRLSHNEDGDPGLRGACGLAEVRPIDAPAFVSFVYPGSLPGHTFAVNRAGLAMTVNNIRACQASPGLPRMALTRALLTAQTPQQAVSLLQSYPRMGAFHLGLGLAGYEHTYSVEFSQLAVSSQVISQPCLHANHAIHDQQQTLPQRITASSKQRQQHGQTLILQGLDALDILADTSHATEPILRHLATDTDQENTLATVDIILNRPTARWAVYTLPDTKPLYRFQGIRQVDPTEPG